MTKEGEFDFCMDGKEYFVEWYCIWSYDPDYGADADGNRGIPMRLVDDLIWFITDSEYNEVTDPLVLLEAENLVDKHVHVNSP